MRGDAGRGERVPGRVIASGLLSTEADRVAEAFAARGLREVERRIHGEWAALLVSSAPIAAAF